MACRRNMIDQKYDETAQSCIGTISHRRRAATIGVLARRPLMPAAQLQSNPEIGFESENEIP